MSEVLTELLEELETLAKAMPDEDDQKPDPDNDGDDDSTPDGDTDKDEGEPMGKSMTVTMENGETVEAIDAEALIKSFQDRLDANTESFGKVLRAQTGLIKSLQTEIAALKTQGSGRKSVVLNMHGQEDLNKSVPVETREEVLEKCFAAQRAGRLSALDVATAESYANRGMAIPDRIIAATR